MCIGIPQAQTPQPPPPAPRPIPAEDLVAKTADTVGRAGPKKKAKKETFRRRASGGTTSKPTFGGVNPSASLKLKPKTK
jgi:hypothetical protein